MNLKNYAIVLDDKKQDDSVSNMTLLEIQNLNKETSEKSIVDIDVIKVDQKVKTEPGEVDLTQKKYDLLKCQKDHQLEV